MKRCNKECVSTPDLITSIRACVVNFRKIVHRTLVVAIDGIWIDSGVCVKRVACSCFCLLSLLWNSFIFYSFFVLLRNLVSFGRRFEISSFWSQTLTVPVRFFERTRVNRLEKNTNQRKTERMKEWKKWINQDDLYIVTPFLSEMKGTMTTTATTTRCLCVEHILLYAEHDQQSKVILYPKVCPAFAIHISHTIHWPIHGNKLFYSLRSLPRVRWVIFFFLFFFLSYPYCFRLNTLFSACFVHFHSHFFVSLFSMRACSLSLSHFPMVFHN